MKKQLVIYENEIKGPLDINITINSGQTSQPAWKYKNNYYHNFLIIDNQPVLIKLAQNEFLGPLEVTIESNKKIKINSAVNEIKRIFDLEFNLPTFYEFLISDNQLKPAVNFCKGLRLFKAHNLFECLISSICSANNSIIRWNRSINLIKEKWGQKEHFSEGDFFTFPLPQKILQAPEHEVEEMEICSGEKDIEECINNLKACGVGYRGKFMKKVAQMVIEDIDLDKIGRMSYDQAFEKLLEFPGVGPKVADCILLYGYGKGEAFPTDVWIKRIISHLYFDDKDIKVSKIRDFGREQFGGYAGYAQLYLFHYARKSGLLDKLKPNTK
ncbi:MAG: DNA glycosylase [Methanobacteriaceae archaeon]|nr:DNA glycosylase [Methanobacteriaceae archaeon]